jgi:hypothetical protein
VKSLLNLLDNSKDELERGHRRMNGSMEVLEK